MSEVEVDSYRKRFPKGKDWKPQIKNPFGHCGLNEDSYHGMETIGISIEKYEELKDTMEGLEFELASVKQQFYFDMRNKQIEIEVLKNKLREAKGE